MQRRFHHAEVWVMWERRCRIRMKAALLSVLLPVLVLVVVLLVKSS
jgi:hypothetical protein